MSLHYHIDSRWRERDKYPNPAEFTLPIKITQNWNAINRTVNPVKPHTKIQVDNMVHTVKLLNLTIPYDFGGTAGTAAINAYPFLYVSFRSQNFKDPHLVHTNEDGDVVNTAENVLTGLPEKAVSLKDATFVAYCDKIQGTPGNLAWIQYKCNMIQTYRLKVDDSLKFRVYAPDGQTLPIVDTLPPEIEDPLMPNLADPTKQVSATFEVTPYFRDADYDNHFAVPYDPARSS